MNGTLEWDPWFICWTLLLCFVVRSFPHCLWRVFNRFIGVFLLSLLVNCLRRDIKPLSLQEQVVHMHHNHAATKVILGYGGLRGAVGFSLVSMISPSLVPAAPLFVTATLAVVLATVFVQVFQFVFVSLFVPTPLDVLRLTVFVQIFVFVFTSLFVTTTLAAVLATVFVQVILFVFACQHNPGCHTADCICAGIGICICSTIFHHKAGCHTDHCIYKGFAFAPIFVTKTLIVLLFTIMLLNFFPN